MTSHAMNTTERQNNLGSALTGRPDDFGKMSYDEFRRRYGQPRPEERWIKTSIAISWAVLFAATGLLVYLLSQ